MKKRLFITLVLLIGSLALLGSSLLRMPSKGAHAAGLPACGAWNIVASPNPGTGGVDSLSGVVALSASNIYAVGDYLDPTNTVSYALIEHWNGSVWSAIYSGPLNSSLSSISAVSASNIWAVGWITDPVTGDEQTYIVHWNGTIWGRVVSPNGTINGAAAWNFLYSVSALAGNNTWAVGYKFATNIPYQTLILHWDGHAWSVVPSPNNPSGNSSLRGVKAYSTYSVYAVGFDTSGSGSWLVEHWNGRVWSIVANPTGVAFDDIVQGRAVKLSAKSIWDVGSTGDSALIQHWDGTKWTTFPAPQTGTTFNGLVGVTNVPGTGRLWAVGSASDDTGASYTLVETYC